MRYYPHPACSIHFPDVISAVEAAYYAHARGEARMPPKVYVELKGGDFRTMPAYIPSQDIAGVKIVNVHPDNRQKGFPSVMALTIVLDPATGVPLAVLNATMLTDIRTGAAGAVASKYLAPQGSVTLGLVGSGRQAEMQLLMIAEVCEIEEVCVWSRNSANAEKFAEKYSRFEISAAGLEKVCESTVISTTTPSRAPLIRSEWIHEGTHINAIGADAPGKEELDPAILTRSEIFVDDLTQAVHSGEVNVPISEGVLRDDRIKGTIGEVVSGLLGRSGPDAVTVFDSTGLAIQDLAIAGIAMKNGEYIDLPFLDGL